MQGLRPILIGFALAVVLTVLPFGLVATRLLPRDMTLWLVGVAAVTQIMVHLRFFLGIRLGSGDRERNGALIFAFVLLFIMVGGTLWVMGNLNYRMM
ncbi:cytochrome o ubiquinol oxidase subunit IV [Ruegeria sediminis]|uniref:Cytochrome bo(3) ubiquinol oxidase subunit 4 n=1 Tax=Ruegeria sediminis TaxID=2583820 RepID=A0ABY2WZP2_9RHOB|nr:cytochrome o ubiquinol oxidase subunit IV [Ruegeria sediminis]TMV08453.1 cytochrome o ubiquinol oxidase subunit IV [Ruegeria sediminis]